MFLTVFNINETEISWQVYIHEWSLHTGESNLLNSILFYRIKKNQLAAEHPLQTVEVAPLAASLHDTAATFNYWSQKCKFCWKYTGTAMLKHKLSYILICVDFMSFSMHAVVSRSRNFSLCSQMSTFMHKLHGSSSTRWWWWKPVNIHYQWPWSFFFFIFFLRSCDIRNY